MHARPLAWLRHEEWRKTMQRNVKIAAGIAALGLVGAGVAVAAGQPEFGPGGQQHPRFADDGTGLAGSMPGRGLSGSGMGQMGQMRQTGQGLREGGMGPGAGAGMHGGPMAGMGMRMMGMCMEVESEFDFLARMISHHEEAIATAKIVAARSERPEMRAFARNIVKTQTAEIVQMKRWLATWYPGRDATVEYEPMMRNLSGLSGDALDRAFLRDMIPHHMAAVMMSQQVLARGLARHQQLVPFATTIRNDQHAEIRRMATWLSDWFGDSPMGAMGRSGMHR
jgi:uncharacterized protein (DUF305 family)